MNRWLVALTALVVLAAAALVWVLRDAGDDSGADVSSADSADAVVVSSGVKDAVRERAADGRRRGLQLLLEDAGRRQGRRPRADDAGDARPLRPHDGRRLHVEPT